MPASKRDSTRPWSDPDDAPELGAEFFDSATVYDGPRVVRRGRPAGSGTKVPIAVRFDRDVVEAFKADGRGWQTRMNDVLRDVLTRRGKLRSGAPARRARAASHPAGGTAEGRAKRKRPVSAKRDGQ
jgi:uncharacterized protein (DUF4415 family)